ncbi:MAG TPA: glutathionylspermidine synthase family protein [Negativicutes bacterium]|nr:glutathionylspermidine synthase family protein [Negativicutes bacterium]
MAELPCETYAKRREELYGALRRDGIFTWDSMYGAEYALASVVPISAELHGELKQASEALGGVFARTAEVVMQAGDELLAELGLPEATWGAVRASLPELLPTVIGRFDFAATSDGLKMLEFNAETPTDIVEAFYVNGKVCDYFGVRDPNAGLAAGLQQAFARAVQSYQAQGFATERIVFSSVDWHDEDAGTTRYLLSQSGLQAEFVPLSALRVYEDRVQVWDGAAHTPVDLMYRLHPLEKLAEEQDSDGYPTGRRALELIACGKLALINPAAALIAQSKAVQALIWNLHENGEFFSADEHASIQKYVLPTYFENRFASQAAYVTKPVYGREGGAVKVFGSDGILRAFDEEPNYWEQPVIYQQYAELPRITVETLNGLYCGRMIFGAFLVDGQGSGVVARVGSRITGNMAYYQPLCVSDDTSKGE